MVKYRVKTIKKDEKKFVKNIDKRNTEVYLKNIDVSTPK